MADWMVFVHSLNGTSFYPLYDYDDGGGGGGDGDDDDRQGVMQLSVRPRHSGGGG